MWSGCGRAADPDAPHSAFCGNACNALERAAAGGHIEAACWLAQRVMVRSADAIRAMEAAAARGHTAVVDLVCTTYGVVCTKAALGEAVCGGHLECVRRLLAAPTAMGKEEMRALTFTIQPKTRTLVHADGFYYSTYTLSDVGLYDLACAAGNLEIMRLFEERDLANYSLAVFECLSLCLGAVGRRAFLSLLDHVVALVLRTGGAHPPKQSQHLKTDRPHDLLSLAHRLSMRTVRGKCPLSRLSTLAATKAVIAHANGDLDLFDALSRRVPHASLHDAFAPICKAGNIEALKVLVGRVPGDDHHLLPIARGYVKAAHAGHVHVLTYLQANHPIVADGSIIRKAMHTDHVAVIKCIADARPQQIDKIDMDRIVRRGNLALVQYVCETLAAHVDIMETLVTATDQGHADIARYACDLVKRPVDVRSLRQEGASLVKGVVRMGRGDILQRVLDMGCAWNDAAILTAVDLGHPSLVRILVKRRDPSKGPLSLDHVFQRLEPRWALAALKLVLYPNADRRAEGPATLDVDWTNSSLGAQAIALGRVDIVAWLHEHDLLLKGITDPHRSAVSAALNGHLGMVEWLCARGMAPSAKHKECVALLRRASCDTCVATTAKRAHEPAVQLLLALVADRQP